MTEVLGPRCALHAFTGRTREACVAGSHDGLEGWIEEARVQRQAEDDMFLREREGGPTWPASLGRLP